VNNTLEKTISVKDAIEARRSIREYDPAPVPENDLREILRLATLAPSSSNTQPWRFYVITNPEMRAKITEAGFNQRQYATAPVVIAVVADGEDMLNSLEETAHPNMQHDPAALERYISGTRNRLGKMSVEDRQRWAAEQTVYAVSYLTLAAQSLGYATSVMGGFDGRKVHELLELPEHAKVVVMVTMGKAKENGFPHHRHSVDRVTRFIR
jgi:nitroreductase